LDLRHYIEILWRRKWVIVITVVITILVVTFGTFVMKPVYSATTTMRIALATSGSVSYQDYMYADRLINTYVDLATTTPVLDQLTQQLGLSTLPAINVKTVPNTELIQITVEDHQPQTAAIVANTLADILISQSLELYRGGGKSALEILGEQVSTMDLEVNQARTDYLNLLTKTPSDAAGIQSAKDKLDLDQQNYVSILDQYEQARLKESERANSISVVDPAAPPSKPSKPNKILYIGLGLVVGMVGGLGLAFLFENLDNTLYTTDQIQQVTNLSIIGKIPQLGKHISISSTDGNIAYFESFRRLRTNILSVEFPAKTLVITSADPREGKSTIIANLAYIMSQSGRNVVVVDCDLRVPTQHKLFNIENNVGLSSVLEQKSTLARALKQSKFKGVHILTSGPIPANPAELIGSDQMDKVISQLANIFEYVFIDAPAALAVADTAILAQKVDAFVLVICRQRANSKAVESVQVQLNKVKARCIGVIVNRAEINGSQYYYNHNNDMKNKKSTS
jgi:succinoglycan biosynthesis transport protein ExoP